MKIVKIPFVNALGKEGSESSPDLILQELGNVDDGDVIGIEIDNSDVERSERLIYEECKIVMQESFLDKFVFVGGDHSVSFPVLKAFSEKFDCNSNFLIVFDAHADCMEPMREPTHEEWLRAVVENGFVKPENIVLIGARKIEPEEFGFLRKYDIKFFSDIEDFESVADYVTERANGRSVYVSIDVDVVDPAYAPSVSYPEPAGLSSRELFYLLKRVFRIKGLKAIDVVEVIGDMDEKHDFRTVRLAAKIVSVFSC